MGLGRAWRMAAAGLTPLLACRKKNNNIRADFFASRKDDYYRPSLIQSGNTKLLFKKSFEDLTISA
jgi:hypothetical protein